MDANGTTTTNLEKAKFFVIKSYSEEDVHKVEILGDSCANTFKGSEV